MLYKEAYIRALCLAKKLDKGKKQQIRNRMNELKHYIERFDIWDSFMKDGCPEEPTEDFFLEYFKDWILLDRCCKYSKDSVCKGKEVVCPHFKKSVYKLEYCKWHLDAESESWAVGTGQIITDVVEYYMLWEKLGQL